VASRDDGAHAPSLGGPVGYARFRLRSIKTARLINLVAVLVHKSNARENGSIFEAAAGHYSKIRWQRSQGVQLRPDDTLTPDALLNHWSQIADFSKNAEAATTVANSMDQLHQGLELPKNVRGEPIDFTGKVVLVTGAGEGEPVNNSSMIGM
jgi:multifunctional beta-oxidation protein